MESVELDQILGRWLGLEDGKMRREEHENKGRGGSGGKEDSETREVASLEGSLLWSMSGFGKSEVTAPLETQAFCWLKLTFDFPHDLGLVGLRSRIQPRVQAEEEAPDTGQLEGTAGKTLPLANMLFALSPCLKGQH